MRQAIIRELMRREPPELRTLATVSGEADMIAEVRFRAALRIEGHLVTATRIAGKEYTWLIQAA